MNMIYVDEQLDSVGVFESVLVTFTRTVIAECVCVCVCVCVCFTAVFQRNIYVYAVARCMQTIVRVKAYQSTFFDLGAINSYVVL